MPRTFTSKQRSQAAASSSSSRPSTLMPALLTSTSTRPNRATASSTTGLHRVGVADVGRRRARTVAPSAVSAAASRLDLVGDQVERDHPGAVAGEGVAMVRPMPRPAPVTRTTRSCRSISTGASGDGPAGPATVACGAD